MDAILTLLSPVAFAAAMMVALVAGLVKGLVGFAMPTFLISFLTLLVAPDVALAALILPTLATNVIQSLRQGLREALGSVRRFWLFLTVGGVALLASAQLVLTLPARAMFLMIGVPVTLFAVIQLLGRELRLPAANRRIEAAAGAVAGFMGGVSGIWGPPTVAYLTATDTPKRDQMRVQGVVYFLGAALLVVAHLQSGVLRAETLPLSLALVLPGVAGIWLGLRIQDRVDQGAFRRLTLWVLLIAGANLIRRGVF